MLLYCKLKDKIINDMFKEGCDNHAMCAGCPETEIWNRFCNLVFDTRIDDFLMKIKTYAELDVITSCQYKRHHDNIDYCLHGSTSCDFVVVLKEKGLLSEEGFKQK